KVVVFRDAAELAEAAATLFRERLTARPDLAMAVPAGRTPRRMYARLRDWQAREPVDYGRMHVFSIDELCPPAPADGYFWRQVRSEFLSWAGVPTERCHPFDVGAPDLEAMTLGIGTIRGAREVVVLVSGSAKRAPLARLLDGAVDPAVPASALRLHPRCTILADAEAHP